MNTKPKQRFSKALLELSRTTSVSTIFNDFLDFSLLMMRWWDRNEAAFCELEKKYPDRSQHILFSEAFLAMSEIAGHEGTGFCDPFGDFYMEYLSHGRNGQFFTPEPVCSMMARMQINELPDNATVADPCCGSGRLLLAAAKINRKALFFGADIYLVCCKMSVLNFLLNTICGEIAWMNTITREHWKSWQTRKIMNAKGFYMPYFIETKHGDSRFFTINNPPDSQQGETIKQSVKGKIIKNWKEKKTSQLTINFD